MNFGLLRVFLWGLGIASTLLVPKPGSLTVLEWPLLVPTLIAPATVPLLFLLIVLDAIMAKVFLSSATTAVAIQRYKKIIFINLIIALAIIVAWFQFFASLGQV